MARRSIGSGIGFIGTTGGTGKGGDIAGLATLLKNWDEVLDLVSTKEAYKIYIRSAEVIAGAMRAVVPVDTGETKRGIEGGPARRRTMHKRYGLKHAIGSFIVQHYNKRTEVQSFPVALLLEFGSRTQPARPYFRPTWDKLKRTQYNRIVRQLERLLRKRSKKLKNLVDSGVKKDLARKKARKA